MVVIRDDKKVTVTATLDEWAEVMNILVELPYKIAEPIIKGIQSQANEQVKQQ